MAVSEAKARYKQITNRFGYPCSDCGKRVAPGEGVAYTGPKTYGSWRTYCLDHAPERIEGEKQATAKVYPEAITPPPPGITLRAYQEIGARYLSVRDRALLADDMGLGKTVQALLAIPQGSGAIVVCPNSVRYNWASESRKFRPDLTPRQMVKGTLQAPRPGEILITNFESLPAWLDPKPQNPRGTAPPIEWPEGIRDRLAQVVLIVDECHKAKNTKASRSKKVTAISRQCERVWGLTGTPLANRPPDLWGVTNALGIQRRVFPGGYNEFLRLFNAYKDRWGGITWGQPDPSIPDRLRRGGMLRRLKSEVLTELPEKTFETRIIDCTDGLRRELDELWEKYSALMTAKELPPFECFSRVRGLLAKERIEDAIGIVEDYEESETPLIVFSDHREPVEAIGSRERWGLITGETPPQNRAEIVRAFQAGELIGVALTIGAGAEGITLTRASDMLFVDLNWVPANNRQAQDRIHRIGQEADHCHYLSLRSNHPLEEHLHGLLGWKEEIHAAALDRPSVPDPIGPADTPPPIAAPQPAPGPKEETEEEYQARQARMDQEAQEREARRKAEQEERERKRAEAIRLADEALAKRAEEESRRKAQEIASRLNEKRGGLADLPLTADRAAQVRAALAEMSANDEDFASERNAIGFNKPDTYRGHHLTRAATDAPDDSETIRAGLILCQSYPRQLRGKYPLIFGEAPKPLPTVVIHQSTAPAPTDGPRLPLRVIGEHVQRSLF
jgi:hypothetical protein